MWKLINKNSWTIITPYEVTDEEYDRLYDYQKPKYQKVGEEPKIEEKKEKGSGVTVYGSDYEDSCHLGEWCGISGLGCKNPNCPHT